MSSFQLELIDDRWPSTSPCCSTSRPTISTAMATWTAISPPRGASSPRQREGAAAIIGIDDDDLPRSRRRRCGATARRGSCRSRSEQPAPGGVYVEDGWLIDALDGAPQRVLDLGAGAAAAGRRTIGRTPPPPMPRRALLGIAPEAAIAGITSFPGLAHRQELVATIDGVRYINDSKATNADATEKALACYQRSTGSPAALPRKAGSRRSRPISSACGTPS